MKFATLLAVALVCNSLHAQKPESSTRTPASTVLKDYDEAFGQVAERVMRSVFQMDVISYGAPEHNEDEGDSQSLQRQRALGPPVRHPLCRPRCGDTRPLVATPLSDQA